MKYQAIIIIGIKSFYYHPYIANLWGDINSSGLLEGEIE